MLVKHYLASLLLLALALLPGCGGGSSGDGAAATTSPTQAHEFRAVLREIGGSGSSGIAILRDEPTPTIQYDFKGLKPTGAVEASQYAVWLTGPTRYFILGTYGVGEGGALKTGREYASSKVLGWVEEGKLTTLLVTREHPPRLRAALAKPGPEHPKIPGYYGRKVMSGTFTDSSAGTGA